MSTQASPTTRAGKALLRTEFPLTDKDSGVVEMPGFMWVHHDRVQDAVAAIESEARQQEREALAERIEGLPVAIVDGLDVRGTMFVDADENAELLDRAEVLSILRETEA